MDLEHIGNIPVSTSAIASMIRTKGEAGTGNIVQAVRHMREINREIQRISVLTDDEIFSYAKELAVDVNLLKVSRVVNLSQTIEKLKEKGVWVYGADMEGDSIYESDLRGNICLVIGNEGNGLHDGYKLGRQDQMSIEDEWFDGMDTETYNTVTEYDKRRHRPILKSNQK